MSEAIPIIFLTVCLPLWIVFHYITKWRSDKGLTTEDEKMLSEIWESTNRMEERINTLERILDIEAPSWRSRHGA
jgi:phage shock protein B